MKRRLRPAIDLVFRLAFRIRFRLRPGEPNGGCPRMVGNPLQRLDRGRWLRGRWGLLHRLRDAAQRWADPRRAGGTQWPAGFPAPRTCSACGGCHPEDAIALLRDHGWEIERSVKPWKAYLHPPGYGAQLERFALGILGPGEKLPGEEPSHPSPVPPVTVYGAHFTPEQLRLLNLFGQRPTGDPS